MDGKFFPVLERLKPVTMMIRHAERFPIRDMGNPMDALLTEKGKRDAYEYGKKAAGLSPVTLLHSPVERCRQTAENIARGIRDSGGTAEVEGVHDVLGGPYAVGNLNEIPRFIEEYGLRKFLRMWFDGELPDGHLMPLREAAEIEMECIRETSRRYSTSLMLVTHDWNIMIVREQVLGLPHEEVGYPGFLDGITYYRPDGKEFLLAHTLDGHEAKEL
jgi:broad specificity phosphatase PhoE